MKLLSLNILGYKNFEDVKIDFSRSQGKTLVVGTNGSGKSNLLEILSAIFSACYRKEPNVTPHFYFELEYVIERMRMGSFSGGVSYPFPVVVKLRNIDGIITMEAQNTDGSWGIVNDADISLLLPEHVVAVYSGEEKRLWEDYYFSSYDDYNKQYMSGKASYQPQKMIYLNKYYWNLIASVLAIHDITDYGDFLKESIGLNEVYKIHCEFDVAKMKANRNAMAKEMLDIINPEEKAEIELSLYDYNRLKDVCGYESDVFYNMLVLTLYKDYKIITKFEVSCTNGIHIKHLSEGEKKLLLIYGAINIITGENLYLLDEPDAHLHEGRKKEIFDLIQAAEESHFIITSHSPTLTNLFEPQQVMMLDCDNNKTNIIYGDITKAINALTDGQWNYIDHTIFLDKNRPLILVEGGGDVEYIKKAISLFSKTEEKYKKLLNVDMLHAGGASNMKWFIDEIQECLPSDKQVIVVFDRDSAGGDGLNSIIKKTPRSKKGQDVEDHNTYKKDQFFCLKLPRTPEYVNSEFVIEDYFAKSYKKSLAQTFLDNVDGTFNNLPNDLKKAVKERLSKDIETYDVSAMEGFRVLLDKLISIIDGTETIVAV